MRAVTGSYSMPVRRQVSRSALGQQREEQSGAHARFQHAAPGKAQPFGGSPESTDDRLRRVVGVLRGALQGGVFRRRDGGFERRADLLPVRPERVLAGAAEAVLRQFRRTEADEAQQLRLLVRRSVRGPTAPAPSTD